MYGPTTTVRGKNTQKHSEGTVLQIMLLLKPLLTQTGCKGKNRDELQIPHQVVHGFQHQSTETENNTGRVQNVRSPSQAVREGNTCL
jgi:hypothetical protein